MIELSDSLKWLKRVLLVPAIVLNGWVLIQVLKYFEPFVTVFIAASVFAFVLNHPVEFLQKRQINRNLAIFIVLVVSLLGVVTLGVTLLPALSEQLSSIIEKLPAWFNVVSQKLQTAQTWASAHRLPVNFSRVIRQLTDRFPERIESLGDETLSLTLNAVGGVSSLLLTVVLTFYLLLDGKRIWNTLVRWLPLANKERIQRSLQNDFRSYYVGQATVGLILGTLLSLVLFVFQVPYSLLLGLMVGVMSMVPFGDTLGYIILGLILLAQSPGLALTAFVAVLVVDQIVDQAITPRILGNLTGLKPIWVIVALLLGTKVLGLSALLIAVPVASFIGTLLEDESLLDQDRPFEEQSTFLSTANSNDTVSTMLMEVEEPSPQNSRV